MPQVPSDSAGGLWGRGLGPVQPLDPVQDEVNAERELRVVVAAVPDDRVLTMARGVRPVIVAQNATSASHSRPGTSRHT